MINDRGYMVPAILIALCSCVTLPAMAATLKVAPAAFIISDITPGENYDVYRTTGVRLTISNDDDVAHTWALSAERPGKVPEDWELGYAEIPDPKWCSFDVPEITIPPKNEGYAHFFLKIPEKEEYFNQHWVVGLSVSAPSEANKIGLGALIRAQLETTDKADITAKPLGAIGLAPNHIFLGAVTPGVVVQKTVTVYNNGEQDATFKTKSLFKADGVDSRVYLTSSYLTLPEPAWLSKESEIVVKAGQSGILHLSVNVPDRPENWGQKWEELILVGTSRENAVFVRVQIATEAKVSDATAPKDALAASGQTPASAKP